MVNSDGPKPGTNARTGDEQLADAVLAEQVNRLARAGGGTLEISDGVHLLGRPLTLPWNVSLSMAPGAVLRAAEQFTGDAVVRKGFDGENGERESFKHRVFGVIRGGTVDGAKHAVTGILIGQACRLEITQMEIVNCRNKGIHVGLGGWYEVNVSHVRIALDFDVPHEPGSIGLHYQSCGDSLVNAVIVIGYETGVRSDYGSNDFHQLHVWNVPAQGPLKVCFACNGPHNSWNQCYADSPFDGEQVCYGFHVTQPYNRITSGRIYLNKLVPPDRAVGVRIEPGGEQGMYLGNHFTALEGHEMRAAFEGNVEQAWMFGNTYSPGHVLAGRIGQQPATDEDVR